MGAGPNGLAAAITLQRTGLSVLLVEGKETVGGGLRSAELTLPGFRHDIGAAIHPMAVGSPFFQSVPLADFGLRFARPPVAAAHPLDGGRAGALRGTVADTARSLGADEQVYRDLLEPLVDHWPGLAPDVLGPLGFPKHPLDFAAFGLNAIQPITLLAKRFKTPEARGLLAGMAAHATLPLTNLTTSAIALVLMTLGHRHNWPIPIGGSEAIARAMAAYFQSLGGTIITNWPVSSLAELPPARAVLLDVTPRQLLALAGDRFSALYRRQLERFQYGMGVFKVDWALDGPIPFTASACRQAGTVHIGGTLEEIRQAEQQTAAGTHPDRPFVLLAQQSLFDDSRAPAGKHTAWAYCHVPNGSTLDRTDAIERQIERFAPGFRDQILARHTLNTTQLETYNPNIIGGDINGGRLDITQLFTRPIISLSPYNTSAKGMYVCSSSTPPGSGVHGMCGFHAANRVLADLFV